MIASAAARQPLAEVSSATLPRMRVILSAGSGSPITPVEARKTSDALQPTVAAAASATARTPAKPAWPVKAFALPLFTTRARALPCLSWLRHQSTGAEAVLDRVKTPAAWVPGASTANRTSVRFWYLTPASPVASRTPARGGRVAKRIGAKGDTAWAAILGVGAAFKAFADTVFLTLAMNSPAPGLKCPDGADHLGKSPFGKGLGGSEADLAACSFRGQKIPERQI